MSAFWVAASALLVAVVAALVMPLVRRTRTAPGLDHDRSNVDLYHDQLAELARDLEQGIISQDQFDQARVELDQRLLADVSPPAGGGGNDTRGGGAWRYVAIACVPLGTVLGYLALGNPGALDVQRAASREGTPADHQKNLDQLTERLAARLQANPQDTEAWVLLARSYQMLGRAPQAVQAFAKAIELIPDSAQLYADYADVQVEAANGEWTQGANDAVAKALAIDAQHPKSLWLAGTAAYTRKDYRAALGHWEKLLALAEPGSEVARMIEGNIAEVRSQMGPGGSGPARSSASTSQAAKPTAAQPDTSKQVAGTVTLDPALAKEVAPSDTVFVFARAAQGPRVPLAIRRATVKDLPLAFALDDSHAMAPGMTISAFEQVVVGARISRSGDAMPRAGDLEGLSAAVKPGTRGIEVRIQSRVN